eukprot:654525-Pleurochrysis_carterae.AAC.2
MSNAQQPWHVMRAYPIRSGLFATKLSKTRISAEDHALHKSLCTLAFMKQKTVFHYETANERKIQGWVMRCGIGRECLVWGEGIHSSIWGEGQ